MLTMAWGRFFLIVVSVFVLVNGVFALAFLACGDGALAGTHVAGLSRFGEAFFFSAYTFATVGYGNVVPASLGANLLATFDSLVGLLGFALATGLVFARFSRPVARIRFSRNAIVAPYRDMTAFEFRIANARSNEIVELSVQILYTRFETVGDDSVRRFYPLALERQKVTFFPLAWTIVHPIDAESPLRGVTQAQLVAEEAEFLILLTGMDETFSQTVHARSSYKPAEVVWGARFSNIFTKPDAEGRIRIDLARLDEVEKTSS
jgi:inward rectifier potassium channel